MKNLIFIGPFDPANSGGMAFSNQVLYSELQKTCNVIQIETDISHYLTKGNPLVKVYDKLKVTTANYATFKKHLSTCENVYITLAQSKFGILRYYPFIRLAKKKSKNVVLHYHGNKIYSTYHEEANSMLKKIIHEIMSPPTTQITLTESLKKELETIQPDGNFVVVDNFSQDEIYLKEEEYEKKREIHLSPIIRLLYFSNIIESKGIFEVIDAVKDLDYVQLTIAGSVEQSIKEQFNKKIQNQTNINYIGFVRGEEKRDLLMNHSVFILPTAYPNEGQPISIIENLCNGNLVLTTYYKGIPDTLGEAYNEQHLYIEKNVESIKEQLALIHNDPNYFSEFVFKHLNYYQNRFSVETFVQNIYTLFK